MAVRRMQLTKSILRILCVILLVLAVSLMFCEGAGETPKQPKKSWDEMNKEERSVESRKAMLIDNRESARIDFKKAQLAMQEMAAHPVGLKNGENLINTTVMVSCFVNGMVYFLATVETRQQEKL